MAIAIDHSAALALRSDEKFIRQLSPLTEEERSFEKALKGELAFASMLYERLDTKAKPESSSWLYDISHNNSNWIYINQKNALLNQAYKYNKALAELSSRSWEMFWLKSPLIELERSWQSKFENPNPDFMFNAHLSYIYTVQNIDVRLTILRALRRVYNGAPIENHGEPALPLWKWEWQEKNAKLCLVPDKINASHHFAMKNSLAEKVCMEHLLY